MSIKAILTDLDGVIRHWDQTKLSAREAEFGLPIGTVFSICFEKSLLMKVITGHFDRLSLR